MQMADDSLQEVVAIDGYLSASGGISFKSGDRFKLESDADTTNWLVERKEDGTKFYAPSQFLVKEIDLAHLEWISLNVTREAAEETLMDAKYAPGSFIIRQREKNSISHLLALSIKVPKTTNPLRFGVGRFLIKRENGNFRVDSGRQTFESLTDLVNNYSGRLNTSNISLKFSVKKDQWVTQWEYDATVIQKGKRLDGGDFGEVFLGRIFATEIIALKTPNLAKMDEEDFFKEADVSRPCKHPYVLETFGICRSELYILTEYLPNGDLKKYLRSHTLLGAECLSIAQKIASAMEYLASLNIVHRDLAARNILVGETIDTIKVADFGLARNLPDSPYYITVREAFPLAWTAPEAHVVYQGIIPVKKGTLTSAADVWSFAVVLWEMYSNGQNPYTGIATDDLYNKLTVENYRLRQPSKCPDAIYAKMLECWNLDRKARPKFPEIHEFLVNLPPEDERMSNSDTEDETMEDRTVYNELDENARTITST